MPNFVMLVGVPGSGKSTYAKQLKEAAIESDYQIVSRDDIVISLGQQLNMNREITYEESWKIVNHGIVDALLNARLQDALATKQNIILDMTNLTKKTRTKRLASVGKDYTKTVMYFPIEFSTMIERNKTREGKTIPVHVLSSMFETQEIPTADEGFEIIGTIT